MSSLSSILLSLRDPEALVADLAQALEAHIASKSGLSGAAMKLGYAALRSAKPDIASRAAQRLLPDIAQALDPLYAEFAQARAADFGGFLTQHGQRASSVVLGAVDARMGSINNSAAKTIYQRFRGSAGDELQKLLPVFGRILNAHIGGSTVHPHLG